MRATVEHELRTYREHCDANIGPLSRLGHWAHKYDQVLYSKVNACQPARAAQGLSAIPLNHRYDDATRSSFAAAASVDAEAAKAILVEHFSETPDDRPLQALAAAAAAGCSSLVTKFLTRYMPPDGLGSVYYDLARETARAGQLDCARLIFAATFGRNKHPAYGSYPGHVARAGKVGPVPEADQARNEWMLSQPLSRRLNKGVMRRNTAVLRMMDALGEDKWVAESLKRMTEVSVAWRWPLPGKFLAEFLLRWVDHKLPEFVLAATSPKVLAYGLGILAEQRLFTPKAIKTPTDGGITALHAAALRGYGGLVRDLIREGADPCAKTTAPVAIAGIVLPAGSTPSDAYAIRRRSFLGHPSCRDFHNFDHPQVFPDPEGQAYAKAQAQAQAQAQAERQKGLFELGRAMQDRISTSVEPLFRLRRGQRATADRAEAACEAERRRRVAHWPKAEATERTRRSELAAQLAHDEKARRVALAHSEVRRSEEIRSRAVVVARISAEEERRERLLAKKDCQTQSAHLREESQRHAERVTAAHLRQYRAEGGAARAASHWLRLVARRRAVRSMAAEARHHSRQRQLAVELSACSRARPVHRYRATVAGESERQRRMVAHANAVATSLATQAARRTWAAAATEQERERRAGLAWARDQANQAARRNAMLKVGELTEQAQLEYLHDQAASAAASRGARLLAGMLADRAVAQEQREYQAEGAAARAATQALREEAHRSACRAEAEARRERMQQHAEARILSHGIRAGRRRWAAQATEAERERLVAATTAERAAAAMESQLLRFEGQQQALAALDNERQRRMDDQSPMPAPAQVARAAVMNELAVLRQALEDVEAVAPAFASDLASEVAKRAVVEGDVAKGQVAKGEVTKRLSADLLRLAKAPAQSVLHGAIAPLAGARGRGGAAGERRLPASRASRLRGVLQAIPASDRASLFATVDRQGRLPVHLACDVSTLQALERRGADLNAPGAFGQTVLHAALLEEWPTESLGFLLGVDDERDCRDGFVDLGAASEPQPRVDVNARMTGGHVVVLGQTLNQAGWTPLHAAVAGEASAQTVRQLLNAGADPNLRDTSGRTAGELAVVLEKPTLAKALGPSVSSARIALAPRYPVFTTEQT